jgi:hypothetical protein
MRCASRSIGNGEVGPAGRKCDVARSSKRLTRPRTLPLAQPPCTGCLHHRRARLRRPRLSSSRRCILRRRGVGTRNLRRRRFLVLRRTCDNGRKQIAPQELRTLLGVLRFVFASRMERLHFRHKHCRACRSPQCYVDAQAFGPSERNSPRGGSRPTIGISGGSDSLCGHYQPLRRANEIECRRPSPVLRVYYGQRVSRRVPSASGQSRPYPECGRCDTRPTCRSIVGRPLRLQKL